VTITFSFKAIPVVADPTSPVDYTAAAGWTSIGTPHTMALCAGTDITARLPYVDGGGNTITMYAQQRPVEWTFPAGTELPVSFLLKAEINWSHDEDDSNDRAYSYYVLEQEIEPVDLMLVHDMSGSMQYYGYVSPAKDKAQLLCLELGSNDRVGIVSFATNRSVNTPFTSGSQTYNETALDCTLGSASGTHLLNALNAITSMTVGGCTPIGQGLIRARDQLIASPNTNKAIVLLSDGEENVAPFINPPAEQTCSGYPTYPDFDPATLKTDHGINVYPVVLGASQAWAEQLLEALATATGGKRIFLPLDNFDLGAAYQMIRELVTFDDMLLFERGKIGGNNQYTANMETLPGELLLSLQWPFDNGATQLGLRISHGGDQADYLDIAQLPHHRGKSFLVVRIPKPQYMQWHIEVYKGDQQVATDVTVMQEGTPYTLAVYTDRVGVQFIPKWQTKVFKTGEPIIVEVRGLYHRTPFAGAVMKARAKIPSRTMIDSLRRHRDQLKVSGSGAADQSKVVQIVQKLKKILKDKPLVEYRHGNDFDLRDDGLPPDKKAGDGIYTGELTDTAKTGMYDIHLRAEPKQGSPFLFNWSYEISALVKVGDIDGKKSKVVIKTIQKPDKPGSSRLMEVLILPVDIYGNPLKPGYAGDIKLTVSQGTLQGGLIDNLDSTYSQFLRLAPGEIAAVKVNVRGVNLGTVHTQPFDKYELSGHLGLAIPRGSTAITLDAGPAFGLDFTYRVSANLALKALYSFNLFNDPAAGSLSIHGLNGYLQYRHLPGNWTPYFEAGLGFYLVENGPEVAGAAMGLGGLFTLTRKLGLDISLHFHQLLDDNNTRFLQLLGGLYLKF